MAWLLPFALTFSVFIAEIVAEAPQTAEPVEPSVSVQDSASVPAIIAGDESSTVSFVDQASKSLEMQLGLSAGAAQVVAWVAILLGMYVAVQILQGVARRLLQKRRQRGKLLLLLGQCGSGKTALFFQMRDQVEVQSVSSLKPQRDTLQLDVGKEVIPVDVMDYPGHQRLRGKLTEFISEARCIIYMLDSEDKQRLKDVAENFYELLTNPELCDLHTPILLACNKVDLPGARTEKFILEEIEREIEQMRISRSATLEGQDQAESYLGVDGEKFKLLQHSPCPIQMCRISTKKRDLEPVYDFIREQYS